MTLKFPFFPKWGQFLSIFLLCVFVVVGCNSPQSSQQSSSSNRDRVAIGTTIQPRTLDPADSYEIGGLGIIYNVGDTLYTYEPGTTNLKPLLAKEMPTISPDGLTYTIPLRSGVKFHDDTPFNAEAMKFSLERFIKNGGKPSFLLGDAIDTITANGESELQIKLKQPFAAFPSLLAFAGACAVSPKSYEIGEGKFNPNQLVGTGPYKLAEFSSSSIRLDVNPNYWGDKPKNKGVDVQIYNNNSANLFNAFKTGAVDLASQSLDPDQIKTLLDGAKNGEWQGIESPGSAVNFLVLNRNQKPLDKLEVRQAIAAAVDRKLINERVLQGQGQPLYSLIPTAFDSSIPVFEKAYGDANLAKAKELLTKAGYSASNPATIPIWFPSASTVRGLVAQTLQAVAEQSLEGMIKFEPNPIEGTTFFKNVKEGIYPATLSNWYPDFLDPDNYLQPLLSCTKGSDAGGCSDGSAQSQGSFYYNKEVNELINKQRQETDLEKRKQIIATIQEKIAEEVPYLPLWQNKDYLFARSGLSGVILNPSQNIPFWLVKK